MDRRRDRDGVVVGVGSRPALRARLAGVMALVALGIGSAPGASAAPITILPLGDSVTYGYSSPTPVPGGYRSELFRDLTAAGYDPRFVGNSIANPDLSLPPQSSPQEGHPGYLIDGQGGYASFSVNTYINQWLAPNNGIYPNDILLMLGANNILGQYEVAGAPFALGALITRISELRPNAHILVSTLTPQGSAALEAQVQQFNKTLSGPDGVVAQLQRQGENVSLVDVGSSITQADLSDLVHPTQAGYNKLGDAWFRAISGGNLTPVAAPEPSTLALLGTGFVGLVAASRARKRAARA